MLHNSSITNLGTILQIWAHPDDETWCAAGLTMAARANEQRVVCVTATCGEAGKTADATRWPQAQLGAIRKQELDAALKIMDVSEHYWLEYGDGTCAESDEGEALGLLCSLFAEIQPDTIITFGPDGLTGHPDHKTVSHWANLLVQHMQPAKPPKLLYVIESSEWYGQYGKRWDDQFNLYFMTDKPATVAESQADICYRLSPGMVNRKLDALAAQPSQMEHYFTKVPPQELRAKAKTECFRFADSE